MREIGFDAERLPLGKLRAVSLNKGLSTLKELAALIIPGSGGDSTVYSSSVSGFLSCAPCPSGSAPSAYKTSRGSHGAIATSSQSDILRLSNQFYSLVPHISYTEGGGTRGRLPLINNTKLLGEKANNHF